MSMIVVPADLADLPRLLQFRADTAAWLQSKGIDQWAVPFPTNYISDSIRRGEVFLIKEALASAPAATVTLDRQADELLWTETERREEALYVHKLTVDRRYAGQKLGVRILDWAGDQASLRGARWLRLDAWTTNPRLQQYYRDRGFEHVRTVYSPEVGGSGWVAQRPARRNANHGLTCNEPGLKSALGVSPVGATPPEGRMGS